MTEIEIGLIRGGKHAMANSGNVLSDAETEAAKEFIKSVTFPILHETAHAVVPYATGTVFRIAGRLFLVTASHVFDDVDLEKLGYPATRVRSQTDTFGRMIIERPKNKSVDLAVAELLEPETIGKIANGWRVLSLENVGLASQHGDFVLAGYPGSEARVSATTIESGLIRFNTKRILTCPLEVTDEMPGLDLFFGYGREGFDQDGKLRKTPPLHGVSGASVWEIRPSESKCIWTADNAVRLVGVQSAFVHSKFFRAQSWLGVAQILRGFDSEIAEAVDSVLKPI